MPGVNNYYNINLARRVLEPSVYCTECMAPVLPMHSVPSASTFPRQLSPNPASFHPLTQITTYAADNSLLLNDL